MNGYYGVGQVIIREASAVLFLCLYDRTGEKVYPFPLPSCWEESRASDAK